jgi:hypothetical protein
VGRPTIVCDGAPKIGRVSRVSHAIPNDVVARVVLPLAVDRNKGTTVIDVARLLSLGADFFTITGAPGGDSGALAFTEGDIVRLARARGRFAAETH